MGHAGTPRSGSTSGRASQEDGVFPNKTVETVLPACARVEEVPPRTGAGTPKGSGTIAYGV
jgi:hypothetical protein